jgi:hypothetical protein
MRAIASVCWTLICLAIVGGVGWLLGMGDLMRASMQAGHLLDWVMGFLCLLWLLIILKVPWDLYFQAQQVAFELQRAGERKIEVSANRADYIQTIRRRLAWLAITAHLFSAALVTAITYFSGGKVGYYFAVFYLVSTAFRPAVAGYVYLSRKLAAIGEEARYPYEDVMELRSRVQWQEVAVRDLIEQFKDQREALQQETQAREAETRALRQSVHNISREFETTVSRLTDNQEVIKGIQAFVRLIAQSTQS